MRLKLSLLAVILLASAIGIPWYLDARIPRATAVVQVHSDIIPPPSKTFSRGRDGNFFETIVSGETLKRALKNLRSDNAEKKALTDGVIESLREKISAKPRRGTDFIEITAKHESKDEAIRIANAVAQAFLQRQNDIDRDRAKRALAALDEELEAQEVLVKKSRSELTPLIGSYGIPQFSGDQSAITPTQETSDRVLTTAFPDKEYKQAKEAYDQSRIMLREMIIKQKEARRLLLTPPSSVTLHEPAQ